MISFQKDMEQVWKNLELIENSYEQMFLKTHRIQANRICLGDLTGKLNSVRETRHKNKNSPRLRLLDI